MNNLPTHKFSISIAILGLALSGLAIGQQSPSNWVSGEKTIPQATITVVAVSHLSTPIAKKSLYDRLGGVFAISAVIDRFSDAVVENPMVGKNSKNPALQEWSTEHLDRLPGLKFMRTLWVCNITGGPFKYTATRPGKTRLGLENAHRKFNITSAEFDEVAAELGRALDFYKVPKPEKGEVLAAFAAHKHEVLGG